MTKTCVYCCLIFFILPGCHKNVMPDYLEELIRADSLAETAPDSAYAILKNIEYPEEMADPDFAYWCMISGEIFNQRTDQDKQFLPSSFYKRACKYYMQYGTPEEKSYIRLYLGRAYQKASEYNQAMQIYAEALKDAKAWNEYNAAGMICSYMGDVYQTQYLSDRCKEKYRESLSFFTLANNQKRIAYANAELGFEYFYDEKPEEGLGYLLQADSIASVIQDSTLIGDISYYLGVVYSELNNYWAAEQSLLKALQFARAKMDSIIAYYAICDIYITKTDYQKAREALEFGIDDQTKDGILYQHYLIEKGENHFEQALTYLEQYQEALDSIQTEQKKMHTLEIEEKYNLEHAENQKNKARIDAFRYLVLLLIVMVAFLLSIVLYHLMRRQKNRIISQQRQELSKADGAISHISTQLQQEKETLKKAKDTLRLTNLQYDTNLSDLQRRIYSLHEELFAAILEKITHISVIGKKIRKMTERVTPGGKTLTANEWNTLDKLFRQAFPALEDLFGNPDRPFTESEVHLSLLTFFNLEAKQESIIMNITPLSVYKQRTRLRQTLQLKEDNNLFEYLKNHCIAHE